MGKLNGTSSNVRIFIGYDDREKVAFYTFMESLIANATVPLSVTPLALSTFSDYEEVHTDGSNQFIYSRFLTPYLSNFEGYSIFFDGDMLCRVDIKELISLIDPSFAVQVVKHDYKTKFPIKYLGAKNEDYPRKNWSSVIVFNNAHPANRILTPEFVKDSTGSYLHRFSWLSDEQIGEIPKQWNWLASEYADNPSCKILHYTLGTPCFRGYENQFLSEEWVNRRDSIVSYLEPEDSN